MKMNFSLIVILFAFCSLLSETLSSQDIYRQNYSGDIESLLQDQATVIFEGASKILAAYPPTPNPGIERKLALYYLDALLHDTRLDKGPAFMTHVKNVAGSVAAELSQNKLTGREVRVLRGDAMIRENIPVPAKNTSLDVKVYQGKQENNVYFITLPEGQTIMHVGDQTYYEDLVDKININTINVDILLMGCAGNIFLTVPEIKPSFVFLGHENEMEHGIDHREPYWLSFRRSNGLSPVLVPAWGEPYTIVN